MATSQNGWTVYDDYGADGLISNPVVPGTGGVEIQGGLDRRAAPLLLEVARLWHTTVEPLRQDWGQWGYSKRPIRGGSQMSNHSSGTAVDLNASRHPLGTSPASTLPAAGVIAARRIAARWPGVIRWGGDYTGRKDTMHYEIVGTPAAVARAVNQLEQSEDDMPLNADDLAKIDEIVTKRMTTILLNTPIKGSKNYTIPIALKELLMDAGKWGGSK